MDSFFSNIFLSNNLQQSIKIHGVEDFFNKEFIDKIKEPYWETPEYRKVENHFKAEFDAWKEVKQATAQRPLRPIFGTYTPLQEAEEAFDNLLIEREKSNGFANDYYNC